MKKSLFSITILIFVFFLTSINLNAQTPVNYSGKWQYDKDKSTPDELAPDFDGTITLEIVQNNATITLGEIYTHPERPEWKTTAVTYDLDGKEKISKSSVGTNKNSATWSNDMKILTFKNTETQLSKGVVQDFVVIDTYKLSDDGLILTIEKFRKNPVTGESTVEKVYSKK